MEEPELGCTCYEWSGCDLVNPYCPTSWEQCEYVVVCGTGSHCSSDCAATKCCTPPG